MKDPFAPRLKGLLNYPFFGCPDPDNDGDGVPDVRDLCPVQPEEKDGFEDQDGCPGPDNWNSHQ